MNKHRTLAAVAWAAVFHLIIAGIMGPVITFIYWTTLTALLWFSDKYYFFDLRTGMMKSSSQIRGTFMNPVTGDTSVGKNIEFCMVWVMGLCFTYWGWPIWVIVPVVSYHVLIEMIIQRTRREFEREALNGNPPPNFYVFF